MFFTSPAPVTARPPRSPTAIWKHYSEIYPDKSRDEAGMLKFFRQFSFPGGIGSHCTTGNSRFDSRRRRNWDTPSRTDTEQRSTI